jgi:hypothetical protein
MTQNVKYLTLQSMNRAVWKYVIVEIYMAVIVGEASNVPT